MCVNILCLILVTILHWAYLYFLAHQIFYRSHHYLICFLILTSRHIGAYPISGFIISHVGFMVVCPFCQSLRVITQGIPPFKALTLGHISFLIEFIIPVTSFSKVLLGVSGCRPYSLFHILTLGVFDCRSHTSFFSLEFV